jgi:hypothetical protein
VIVVNDLTMITWTQPFFLYIHEIQDEAYLCTLFQDLNIAVPLSVNSNSRVLAWTRFAITICPQPLDEVWFAITLSSNHYLTDGAWRTPVPLMPIKILSVLSSICIHDYHHPRFARLLSLLIFWPCLRIPILTSFTIKV